jgi:ABC-type transport system involved in multi-copper enzyme maturation permease subunit
VIAMINLLRAGFVRLRKSNVFWTLMIVSVIIAVVLMKVNLLTAGYNDDINPKDMGIDEFINSYIYLSGMLIAVLSSIFVGGEYTYGIIRNKIVVGHSRTKIYLANLIISIVGSIIIELVYIAVVVIFGTKAFGGLKMTINELLYVLGRSLVIIITFSSIYTAITLVSSDMTSATIMCLIYFILTLVGSTNFAMIVYTPKYITEDIYNDENELQIVETLNPDYLGDTKVRLLRGIYCSLPAAQAYDLTCIHTFSSISEDEDTSYMEEISDKTLLTYAVISIVIVNGIGIYLFNKKELK